MNLKRITFVFFTILSLTAFFISFEKATFLNLDIQNHPPCLRHIFGTDDLGRDVFSRCLYGLKISLMVGFLATLIDMVFGSLFGILSSSLPHPYSKIMTRFLDVMTILPQMLLSILILMIVKHGLLSLILAISVTGWLPTARAIRLEMLKLQKMDFVTSLKGFGFSQKQILLKHLIPSCLPTLLVSSAICLPQAIFSEAFMSFLGLGVAPPTPSLGNMISEGLAAIAYYPWRLLFPSSLVFFLILSLHIFTDRVKKMLGVYS
jgi:oligopeptide transport system permease protein